MLPAKVKKMRRGQRSTNSGQVPDRYGARFASNDQRSAILEQLYRPDVVVALLVKCINNEKQQHSLPYQWPNLSNQNLRRCSNYHKTKWRHFFLPIFNSGVFFCMLSEHHSYSCVLEIKLIVTISLWYYNKCTAICHGSHPKTFFAQDWNWWRKFLTAKQVWRSSSYKYRDEKAIIHIRVAHRRSQRTNLLIIRTDRQTWDIFMDATHQAVELWNWCFGCGVTNIPNLDASLQKIHRNEKMKKIHWSRNNITPQLVSQTSPNGNRRPRIGTALRQRLCYYKRCTCHTFFPCRTGQTCIL